MNIEFNGFEELSKELEEISDLTDVKIELIEEAISNIEGDEETIQFENFYNDSQDKEIAEVENWIENNGYRYERDGNDLIIIIK